MKTVYKLRSSTEFKYLITNVIDNSNGPYKMFVHPLIMEK